jgi:hypothetical protein
MSDIRPTDIVPSLQFAIDVFGGINSQIILRGGTGEDILKLNGPDRFKLAKQIAALLVPAPLTEAQERAKHDWNYPLEELEFRAFTHNALKRADVDTIGDLIGKTDSEVLNIRGIGKKSYAEILETLRLHRLQLGTRID